MAWGNFDVDFATRSRDTIAALAEDMALPYLVVLHEWLTEDVHIDRGYCETCEHEESWDWRGIDALGDYCKEVGIDWLGVVDTSSPDDDRRARAA